MIGPGLLQFDGFDLSSFFVLFFYNARHKLGESSCVRK